LRQALVDSHDGDTIDFGPSLKGQTISLTSTELVINKSIVVSGPGPNLLAVSRAQNAPAFRIFNLMPGRSVTIQGLTISNGVAPDFGCGGGILDEGSSLSLFNCTVSGNSTGNSGGGVCVQSNATLTIDGSTLSANYAGDYGGGMANDGTVTINNSTLSGNRGEFAAGAILNGFNAKASLTLTNSTLSGNTTQLHGGGIFNGGQSAVSNSTFSGNSGMTAGAIVNRLGTLDIKGTILNGGELGPNISNDSGTVTSHGYNLSSDDGGGVLNGPGDQINTNPLLGPLQNNGGPTFTQALLPGSAGIDTGDPKFTPPPLYDQRGPGFDRVVNSRIDKGSFEVQPTPTPTAPPTPTTTPTEPPRMCRVSYAPCDAHFITPPTDFNVDVSCDGINGVNPSGFTVNNIPADSAITSGGLSVAFHFNRSPAVSGLNTIDISPSAIECCFTSVEEFTCTFNYVGRINPTPRPRPTPHPRR
jgi:hypothetical protein